MSDPVEAPDLDAIRERCDAATPGPWDARWAEPKDEPDRLAKAILLSTEHDRQSATSSTAWRLIAGDDDDWVNLGFLGNGLTSKDNALFIAHAREDVPALAAALVAARERAETAEAERDRLREALQPFADYADVMMTGLPDTVSVAVIDNTHAPSVAITRGALYHARDVLAATSPDRGAEPMTEPKRYCVCGWMTTSDEPHDHERRQHEAEMRSADAYCWSAHEAWVEGI